jgi:hypothetical protein
MKWLVSSEKVREPKGSLSFYIGHSLLIKNIGRK